MNKSEAPGNGDKECDDCVFKAIPPNKFPPIYSSNVLSPLNFDLQIEIVFLFPLCGPEWSLQTRGEKRVGRR